MKILILQEFLPHYRIPVFNQLAEVPGYEVTVAHTQTSETAAPHLEFKQILLQKRKWRGFFFYKSDLHRLASAFDVVIAMQNLRWISLVRLAFKWKRSYKLIYWGIGVNTDPGFDVEKKLDPIRALLAKKSDATIFYSAYPIDKYKKLGVSENKMFVAFNTVRLNPVFLSDNMSYKDSFLFIGSLTPIKQLAELLEAFRLALPLFSKSIHLNIVGDGELRKCIEQKVTDLGIQDNVFFHGAINEGEAQHPFFKRAFATISPGQAGLSVLQSMAFGVPFVTQTNATTGSERFNIIHGINGILYEAGSENLASVLVMLENNPDQTLALSKNAFQHFITECSIDKMVQGFIQAITYASNN